MIKYRSGTYLYIMKKAEIVKTTNTILIITSARAKESSICTFQIGITKSVRYAPIYIMKEK